MNPDLLRIIAVAQGVACMLGVIAFGIATGCKWGPWLAIVALGFAYLSTSFFAFSQSEASPSIFAANILSGVAAIAGFTAILLVIL